MALLDKHVGITALRDVYFIDVSKALNLTNYREVLLMSYEDCLDSRLSGSLLKKALALFDAELPESFFIRNYTDASIGGNDVMNPHFQFGVDTDLVHPFYTQGNYAEIKPLDRAVTTTWWPGMSKDENDRLTTAALTDPQHPKNIAWGKSYEGLGRVYAEMYNSNQQILWFRVGVPRYTGLNEFYRQTEDVSGHSELVNNGRSASFLYKFGSILTSSALIAVKLPFYPFIWGYKAAMGVYNFAANDGNSMIRDVIDNNFMRDISASKYCYLKPTMFQYYRTVNSIIIELAVNMGLITSTNPTGAEINNPEKFYSDLGILEKAEVLEHGPDIFAILDKRYFHLQSKKTGSPPADHATDTYAAKLYNEVLTKANSMAEDIDKKVKAIEDQLNAIPMLTDVDLKDETKNRDAVAKQMKKRVELENQITKVKRESFIAELTDSFLQHATGIHDFVGFRIDKNVDNTESLTNTTGESQLAQRLNGLGQSMREAHHQFQGLTTGISIVDATLGVGSDAIKSILNAVGGGQGIELVAGNGYFDIPEIWKSSSWSKNYTFTIQLKSLYGDPVSIFQSIYIPLAMLMAAAFPRSISKNMYTSPFVIEAYSKGMIAIPMGMIRSMTIQRGLPEYGWTYTSLPTSVTVTLEIQDLSPMMFVGMSDPSLLSITSQNDSFHGYLTTLSGLGLRERMDDWKLLNRKATVWLEFQKRSWMSPFFLGAAAGQGAIPKLLFRVAAPFAYQPKN
jgi:hypothetical protein